MGVRVTRDAGNVLLSIGISGELDCKDGLGALVHDIAALDRTAVRHVLVDLEELETDVPLERLWTFVDEAAALLKALGAAKIACVLSPRLNVANVAMSMLFNKGLRIAIFGAPAEALAWLLA